MHSSKKAQLAAEAEQQRNASETELAQMRQEAAARQAELDAKQEAIKGKMAGLADSQQAVGLMDRSCRDVVMHIRALQLRWDALAHMLRAGACAHAL